MGHDEPGLRRRPGRHVHRRLGPLHLDDPERGLKPEDYGITVLPLDGADSGVLGGGTLAAVNVVTTEAERDAAVKWIDFYYIQKLLTEEGAVADAKALTANNQPVGVPALPIFDKATYDESQVWIKDYINVPVDQMTPFTSKIFDQPLVNEPVAHTQELYAALDPVVQAVLTDQNADINALLDAANAQVQADPGRGLSHAAAPPPRGPGRRPRPAAVSFAGPARPRERAIGAMGTISEVAAGRTGRAPDARTRRRLRVTRDGLAHARVPAAVPRRVRGVRLVPDRARLRDERAGDEPRVGADLRRPRELPAGPRRPAPGKAIRNTLWFVVLALVFGYPVPIVLAVLMSEVRRWRGLYSALAYLPVVVPPVVAVLLWRFFYNASPTGVFNTILGWVGLGPLPWLQSAARRCRRSSSRRPGPPPAGP